MLLFSPISVFVLATLGFSIVEANDNIQISNKAGRQKCVVVARGKQQNDVPNILAAFRKCNNGGTVYFPENQNYWIAERLNPVINDVQIVWKGQWTVNYFTF
jgi:galacturan 1,4-alpha-galacturonidase